MLTLCVTPAGEPSSNGSCCFRREIGDQRPPLAQTQGIFMATDGKQLEALVAYVEKMLLPEGFQVSTNERVFNEEGVQIAEFDIEVRGRVGSTSIAWLIECRDRPTSGAAPSSWIEQLVGRRTRFGFNKVTAVSTTGFAVGAVDFAVAQGIELREVKSIAPEDFEWLAIRHLQYIERRMTPLQATLLLDESEPEQARESLLELLSRVSSADAFLRSSTSSQQTTAAEAFSAAVGGIAGVFGDLVADGPSKRVQIHAAYTDQDHFVVLMESWGTANTGHSLCR